MNPELFKIWLLKKLTSYALDLLAKVPAYFENIKRQKDELEKYQESLHNRQLTEEQKRANIIDFVD